MSQPPLSTPDTIPSSLVSEATDITIPPTQRFQSIMEQLQRMQHTIMSQRWTNQPQATANIQRMQSNATGPQGSFYGHDELVEQEDPMQQLQHSRRIVEAETYQTWTLAEQAFAVKDQLRRLEAVVAMSRRRQRFASKEDLSAFDAALDAERDMLVAMCEGWERSEKARCGFRDASNLQGLYSDEENGY